MTAPDVTVSDTPPGCEPGGEWLSLAAHGFSKYEVWSRGGSGREQRPVRNKTTGNLMAVSEGTRGRPGGVQRAKGYLQVKLYNDAGKQETKAVHSLILLANVGPPPEGMQTRHLDSDPWNNRWEPGDEETTRKAGGNLIYGDGPQQRKDQMEAGTAVPPPATFPCVNHARCGGMAVRDGRRCLPCLKETGIRAAALLNEGMPLAAVTRKLGYQSTSERWVFGLARDYGGYRGTITQARTQKRPPLLRRVLGRFRRCGK